MNGVASNKAVQSALTFGPSGGAIVDSAPPAQTQADANATMMDALRATGYSGPWTSSPNETQADVNTKMVGALQNMGYSGPWASSPNETQADVNAKIINALNSLKK